MLFALQTAKVRIAEAEMEGCEVDSYGGLATEQVGSQVRSENCEFTHISGSLSLLFGLITLKTRN